jgi:hypothetical protein
MQINEDSHPPLYPPQGRSSRNNFPKIRSMWIIIVVIAAMGAGTATYRASTGYGPEPAASPAAGTPATPTEAAPGRPVAPASRPAAGS